MLAEITETKIVFLTYVGFRLFNNQILYLKELMEQFLMEEPTDVNT